MLQNNPYGEIAKTIIREKAMADFQILNIIKELSGVMKLPTTPELCKQAAKREEYTEQMTSNEPHRRIQRLTPGSATMST